MKRLCLIILVVCLMGGAALAQEAPVPGTIERHPQPVHYTHLRDRTLEQLFMPDDSGLYDLRGADLRGADLSAHAQALTLTQFDSVTLWPERLPEGFDPARLMTLGKDPGCSVRDLHAMGLTGRGVGIGIIDTHLLVDHAELSGRVRFYEENNGAGQRPAQMHGIAVASIALGETVGVAPDALLYFIEENPGYYTAGGFVRDYTPIARAIDRFVQLNAQLPPDERIRVISLSVGWARGMPGTDALETSIEAARTSGIAVCAVNTITDVFHGMGRDPYGDPNDPASARPGIFWARNLYGAGYQEYKYLVLVPMDYRCVASPTGVDDYVLYPDGGLSWSVPYIAGLYALACEANPDVTLEALLRTARLASKPVSIERDGQTYDFGRFLDAVKLLEVLGYAQ